MDVTSSYKALRMMGMIYTAFQKVCSHYYTYTHMFWFDYSFNSKSTTGGVGWGLGLG